MTWVNRLRLLAGLMGVLVIVAGATFVLNQREAQVSSVSASIEAVSYKVATDYSGTLMSRNVQVGDEVAAGDPLVRIQSATLLRALEIDGDVPVSSSYTVSSAGIITLRATEPGVVSSLDAQVGGFVDSGVPVVTIDFADSLFTRAEFLLDPYDFSRIEDGAAVDVVLPDRARVLARVASVKVVTVDGQASTTVEVTSDDFVRGDHAGLVSPGTPVSAVIHLRDDGPISGLLEAFYGFVEKIGLGSFTA